MIEFVVAAVVVLISVAFGYFLGITRNPRYPRNPNPNE